MKQAADGSYPVRSKRTGDKVYLIKDGYRAWIRNPETLYELGFSFGDVRMIPDEQLYEFMEGVSIDLKKEHQVKQEEEKQAQQSEIEVDPILGYRKNA